MDLDREAIQAIKESLEELKRDRKADIAEARMAIGAIHIHLNDLTVKVALLNSNCEELPAIKIAIETLKTQATEIAVERKAERKTAAMIWTGLLGLIGASASIITWVLTGRKV